MQLRYKKLQKHSSIFSSYLSRGANKMEIDVDFWVIDQDRSQINTYLKTPNYAGSVWK